MFDNLAREEEEDFDAAASKGRDLPAFPSFGEHNQLACISSMGNLTGGRAWCHSVLLRCAGNSDASAKQVSEFYSFWQHFVSDQSFDWADEYNLAAAPNRMVRHAAASRPPHHAQQHAGGSQPGSGS